MFDIEDTIPTEETYEGDWERQMLDACSRSADDTTTDNESDSETPGTPDTCEPPSSLTYSAIQTMLCNIREFALQQDDRFLAPVQDMLELTDKCIIQKQSTGKQHTIEHFFAKK